MKPNDNLLKIEKTKIEKGTSNANSKSNTNEPMIEKRFKNYFEQVHV